MNNNNTPNSAYDTNTVISIAPTYDSNASNGNGGNWNVLYLTSNTQMIEDNNIGQSTHKNYFFTLTDIMVWMVDNMPEKLDDFESLKRTNARYTGLLSETKRKQRKFLKAHCKLLLEKINRAAKTLLSNWRVLVV